MDIKYLITFLAFAEEKSYNKVSMRLNYSVSTLTSHIKNLEDELGVEVISSRGRVSRLTPAGEAFVPLAQQILDDYQKALLAMQRFGDVSGTLNVTTSEMVGSSWMAGIFPDFAHKNPQIHITVRTASTNSCKEILNNHGTDLIILQDFGPMEDNRFTSQSIYKEELVLVASPKHALAKRDTVHPHDLKYQTILFPRKDYLDYHPGIQALMKEGHVTTEQNLFLESGMLMRQAIVSSQCLGFLPRSSVQTELEKGTLVSLSLKDKMFIDVYAMYDKNSWCLGAIRELIDFIQANNQIF